MKLRTKTTLFFGIFFLAVTSAVVVYVEYVVGDTLKKQTVHNFRIIAEQSESTYFAFLGGMKTRVVDWTSDPVVQRISKDIISTSDGSPERVRLAKEFASYVSTKKMPYDKTILLTDILDHNGIVIASTRLERIGNDEKKEEILHEANKFTETINSKFGEVFFGSIVFDEENPSPVINATVRLSVLGADGAPQPVDAVLLVYFANTGEIANALGMGVGKSSQTIKTINRTSSQAFLESYKTSNIYLVNNEYTMVTPSRYMQNVDLHNKVDTFPVRECLENGREINEEYDNYQGIRVLGASMCFKESGLVLLVEIQKDEVYASLTALTRVTIAGGLTVLVLGILIATFFVRRPLARLDDVVSVAKRVAAGDLDVQVNVQTKDEIGYLASMFNTMIASIRDARNELEISKRDVEEKALFLEKDLNEHKKQQELLELSKKATINILEDLWEVKSNLQSESNKLQTIITSIGTGLVLIDTQYKIILVNPKIIEMFAIPQEELVGKDLRMIMKLWKGKEKELPVAEWPTEKMFRSKSTVVTTLEDEMLLSTEHKKTQIPVTLSMSPLAGGFPGGVIIIRDATSDHELDEAKSGFISVASHQLRTPLTSIRWYSEMLLSGDVGPLNEAQKDFMDEIHGGAERLYQTVDLLLGISRVESGKIKSEKELVDLTKFTNDIKKELASQIDEKSLTASISPPEGEQITVHLDPLMLRQVVLNLFSNAIRYTNEKGTIEAKWFTDESKKEVVYSVRDNGIGIPVTQRAYIFTKFFRAENARTQVPDGSGLGLALVKELVESWGGKVWFETEEGKGSTFFFTIPFASKAVA